MPKTPDISASNVKQNGNHEVLSHINPFDTEQRAKIAVKFGILRVVMLWASQS